MKSKWIKVVIVLVLLAAAAFGMHILVNSAGSEGIIGIVKKLHDG